MSDMSRSFGMSPAGCADTALEMSRGLGRFWPPMEETPSPYRAGPLRPRSTPALPHLLWNGLLPVPSSDSYCVRWNWFLMGPDMGDLMAGRVWGSGGETPTAGLVPDYPGRASGRC